jgi:glycosyltransferase involved in cell wall biosynthesis
MAHYYRGNELVGWGPTVREIDALTAIFDEIIHIGCLHQEQAPLSSLPYDSGRVRFIPLEPAGGSSWRDKLKIIRLTPGYIRVIREWLPQCDVVHVRCPANIPLISLFVLIFSKTPKYRWIKYAGNWHPKKKEALSYTLQRYLLQHNIHRGIVTINGKWPGQPPHIISMVNPCLTQSEIIAGQQAGSNKILTPPYQLLYIGRLDNEKGVARVLQIAKKIKEKGIPFQLNIVGDGIERNEFIAQSKNIGISDCTNFTGWLPRNRLAEYYAKAHFFIFPSSSSEGWPKVISEAMAYGVVPMASDVSSIPQILNEFQTGYTYQAEDISGFSGSVINLINSPNIWKHMSCNGMKAAEQFSYDNYVKCISEIIH